MKTRERLAAKIQPGDIVKMSRDWLRSIGAYSGDVCFAQGVVKAIGNLRGDGVDGDPAGRFCEVEWDEPERGRFVLKNNLVRSRDVAKEDR